MIHMVTPGNRQFYADQIEEMHRLRKAHFVDERGWSALTVRDGGEYDDWDDERTIYFFALDSQGHIGVSMRARPTDDKCILADVFPHLIMPGTGPVRGKTVWEISRIFATRKFRTRHGIRRRDELFLATVEAAVAAGVERLVGMIDTFLLPQAMRVGWKLKPLGLPAAYPEGEVIAVGISTTPQDLMDFRESMAVDSSLILPAPLPAGAPAPLPDLLPQEIEALLAADRLPEEHRIVLSKLVRSISTAQDKYSEDQLVAMIDYVRDVTLGSAGLH